MLRVSVICVLLVVLCGAVLWLLDSRRPERAQTQGPPGASFSLKGDLVVAPWIGGVAQDALPAVLQGEMAASEVSIQGEFAVIRTREVITPWISSRPGWCVLPASSLKALFVREEEDPSKVASVLVDLQRAPQATLVSLDARQLLSLPDPTQSQEIYGDLWVDPGDPEIAGLGGNVNGYAHAGRDTSVALVSTNKSDFESLNAMPSEVQWQLSLPEAHIVPGTVFLARSSTAKIYKVRIDELEKPSRRMRLAFTRLQAQ